ncbi:MAG TPA: hypothetical protein PKV06_09640, partial [bacterium]|nr:hypothetical protein [bacterium]
NGVTTNYQSNPLNQYTSVGGVAYAYDADGNLTSDGVNTFEYDQRNRLVRQSGPAGVTEYSYDAFGQIHEVRDNGVSTRRVFDSAGGGLPVAEYGASGVPLAQNYAGLGVTSRVAGGMTVWMDYDADGSTAGLTGFEGTEINSYAYTPTGQSLYQTGTFSNPYQFSGQFGVENSGSGVYVDQVGTYSPRTGVLDQYLETFEEYASNITTPFGTLLTLSAAVMKADILRMAADHPQYLAALEEAADIHLKPLTDLAGKLGIIGYLADAAGVYREGFTTENIITIALDAADLLTNLPALSPWSVVVTAVQFDVWLWGVIEDQKKKSILAK